MIEESFKIYITYTIHYYRYVYIIILLLYIYNRQPTSLCVNSYILKYSCGGGSSEWCFYIYIKILYKIHSSSIYIIINMCFILSHYHLSFFSLLPFFLLHHLLYYNNNYIYSSSTNHILPISYDLCTTFLLYLVSSLPDL